MPRFDAADWIALALLLIGGALLGIDGLFGCDALGALATVVPTIASGLKGLIGLSAFYCAVRLLLRKVNDAEKRPDSGP
jgi:uncharacterized membrane protein YuzA (DUF378 family)